MRRRRAGALAALGVLAVGALSLGVAAPAQAVEVAPLRSYMLTVPPSVYSGAAGYSAAEQTVYRDLARNTPDKDDVYAPASPSKGWTGQLGTGAAIWAGGTALLSAGGTLGTVFTVNPQQMAERYEEQGLSDNDWWTQFNCERMGDDWLGSAANAIQDWWTGLLGIDCNAARGDDLDKNDAWQPLQVTDPSVSPYPVSFLSLGVTVTLGVPYWSDVVWTPATGTPRKEGWVVPVTHAGGGTTEPGYRLYPGLRTEQGVVSPLPDTTPPTMLRNGSASTKTLGTQCPPGVTFCMVLDKYFANTTGMPSGWIGTDAISYIAQTRPSGTSVRGNVVPLDYVHPRTGVVQPPAGEEVVFLTTVETADGNTFSCRTRPFKETDADVPQPCDPSVPAGQWEVSRTVEMIPATSTNWTVGSDPRRIMTEQETPQEYRNWRTAFPSCATEVCLMDLRSPAGSCFDQGDACNGWLSDPDKVSKYTCTYDGQTIALSECEAAYPNVFDKTAREQGQAYPQPSGAPATSSPIQTSTSAAPVTTPGSWPASPETNRNCFPTGWGLLNPIEWVYKPVKCVLEWAFVPRESYMNNILGNMRLVWTSSSLVSLLAVLEDGTELAFGASGCEGPPVNLNIMGGEYSGHPLSACASPMAEVATVSRVLTMIGAWVMAGASIARSVAGVVGFTKLGGDD